MIIYRPQEGVILYEAQTTLCVHRETRCIRWRKITVVVQGADPFLTGSCSGYTGRCVAQTTLCVYKGWEKPWESPFCPYSACVLVVQSAQAPHAVLS